MSDSKRSSKDSKKKKQAAESPVPEANGHAEPEKSEQNGQNGKEETKVIEFIVASN